MPHVARRAGTVKLAVGRCVAHLVVGVTVRVIAVWKQRHGVLLAGLPLAPSENAVIDVVGPVNQRPAKRSNFAAAASRIVRQYQHQRAKRRFATVRSGERLDDLCSCFRYSGGAEERRSTPSSIALRTK